MEITDKESKTFDVCIIGGGVIGMFLAIRFLDNGKSVLLVEESAKLGGQINLYKEKIIYNIPLLNEIKALDLLQNLQQQLQGVGSCVLQLSTSLVDIDKNDECFCLTLKTFNQLNQVRSKYIVFATGKGRLEPNKLPFTHATEIENRMLFYNVENEEKFRDKVLIIAGGGDSVIDWSCELFTFAKKIIVIHRRDINRPDNPEFQHFQYLCKTGAIELKIPYNITELMIDNDKFVGIKIVDQNGNEEKIFGDYMLAFYGLKTIQNLNNNIYKKLGIEINTKGINVNYRTNETNCGNVFAVGDCCEFDGKIYNIFMGLADAMRCFYAISYKEDGTKDCYGHKS